MHYLLFYEKAPGYETREVPLQAEHRAYVLAAVKRGELVLAGSLEEPVDGAAVLLFRGESAHSAKEFANADPYVVHGIVDRWHVRAWNTVAGKDAAHPFTETAQ